jgi:tRNA pseudouridine38-40 synthase
MTSKDASATRYILSFKVEEPVIFENGIQWIPTQVVGQSFLLHQIRKMVSIAIDSVRMNLPDLITTFFDKDKIFVSDLAPAQGLFLEMSYYDSYNNKIKSQPDLTPLDWSDETSPTFQRWKVFRNEVLMSHVVQEEDREGNFLQYLYTHEMYFTLDSKYGLSNWVKEEGAEIIDN